MIRYKSAEYRQVTLSLALGSFLIFANLYVFQPMLPEFAQSLGYTASLTNWIFAGSTLALALFMIPWAIVSDAVGRRVIMVSGLLAVPLLSFTMLWFESFWLIVMARVAIGIALAAFASVAVAFMAEELDSIAFKYAIGGYIAANSLGGIFGRLLGGMITEHFDWQIAVTVLAVLTSVGAILVFKNLPQARHFKPQPVSLKHQLTNIAAHIGNPKLVLAMMIGGCNFALFVNLYSISGFRLVASPFHMSLGMAALLYLCYLAGTISSKLTGQWTKKYCEAKGIFVGCLISLMGMLVAYLPSVTAIIAGLLLISFGAFFVHTLAYSWVSANATHARATATALYLVFYYAGGSLGGFWLLHWWEQYQWAGVIVSASGLYAFIAWASYKLAITQDQAERVAT